jgi:hypothetical protein
VRTVLGLRTRGAAVAVAVVAAACNDGAQAVMRDGACFRHEMLVQAAAAMQDAADWVEHRDEAIRLHHRRVTEDAAASMELQHSSYGDDFGAYYDEVKLAIEQENVRNGPSDPGPDWRALEREGLDLASEWGCP